MKHHLRRFLNKDILSSIPPGVNPFKHLIDLAEPAMSYSLSSFSKLILWVLFVLHCLVVLFCLVVLALLYRRGAKQFLWLAKRLNIEDRNGKNAPLFVANTSVLIPITQCVGSLASQGYIVLVIKNVQTSSDRASHRALTTVMVIMFSCEILTYWALSHCFLVAIYASYRNFSHGTKRAKKWMPSPTLINAVFAIFPIWVITACTAVFTWFDSILNPFMTEVFDIMGTLRQGSSIWDQLRISSTSTVAKHHLVTNLTQVVSRAESAGQNAKIHFRKVVNSFMIVQWVVLAQVFIAALVFVLVFCKLAQRFHEQANQSSTSSVSQSRPIQLRRWRSQEGPPSIIQQSSNRTNKNLIDTARSNRQFRHLIIRALFIVIAMLTTMTNLVWGISGDEKSITNPHLRQLLTWLATVSGAWSAIPISWHCWRLYKEQSGETLLTCPASDSKEDALTVYRKNAPPAQSSQPALDEIKIERGLNVSSPLNFTKALEDVSSVRGSLGDSLRNFSP
ncbi:hypothetical protein PCANC_03010 [Puccinia coronata f. sp. avenae]|uniref:Uncharacterized protein n=1 Tax=Puccinia coronata f. sp. avenae TaxID=200324 RepID=A0A2N5W169_9BASI|nr:hypothetical protein PCANC_03010 [Puccinia coronata f. sp. avenae]